MKPNQPEIRNPVTLYNSKDVFIYITNTLAVPEDFSNFQKIQFRVD